MDVTHVAIGIVSADNPEGLKATLAALRGLSFTAYSKPVISIIVVGVEENGPTTSIARAEGNVTYVCEPQRGIPRARNRVLDNLPEGAQALAWLDDDSRPDPDWLDQLLFALSQTNTDMVLGIISARLPDDAPKWIKNGGFFNRRRLIDRATLHEGINNTLMTIAPLKKSNLRFDQKSLPSGISDALFLRRAVKMGASYVWTPKANVVEVISRKQCNIGWLMRKQFLTGVLLGWSAWRIEGPFTAIRRFGDGVAYLLRGIVWLPLFLTGFSEGARALLQIAFGLGLMIGAIGMRPN